MTCHQDLQPSSLRCRRDGLRVLEVGCGPGAAARAVLRRLGRGHALGIDRSAKAIAQATAASRVEVIPEQLCFRQVAVEDFVLGRGGPMNPACAVRVGALDGRHPELELRATRRIRDAWVERGRLSVDGGGPLRERRLDDE